MYMSPEQIQGLPLDNRADLWALGVILYQALTGSPAFEGGNLAEMARSVLNDRPPAPSRRNSGVPARLDAVVEKLLCKDPALRYARAEDLIADLAGIPGTSDATLAATATVTVAVPAPRPAPRLAVLYFEVLSADPDDTFLAAGLTEDLIVDLARVGGLRVAARGEVQPFRGRDLPPRTVAREMNVDFIVQGSVRRAGRRARISAQLVRASDGHATWAERFDRTLEDLFDVQAEVSKRIVEALQVKLQPAEREMLDRAPTHDREAYVLYLRGRGLMDEFQRASNYRAEECLRRAVELDPGFALAHAALAECYGQRVTGWWGGLEFARRARPHAERAIELDRDLPEAHMAMGFVLRMEGDAEGLLREIRLAAPPDTTDPILLRWAGWSYMTQGKPEDALAILERAHRLHPRNYRIASSLTDCYLMLGRTEDEQRTLADIQEVLVEALDREPDHVDMRIILAINLAQSGNREAGLAQAERALAAAPDDGRVRYNAACAFAHAGETERAIEQLRTMVELVPSYLTDWVRRDPDFASLRAHPEFVRMFGRA
jgi:TolB-like protein/Flp pilus assembly protein TadD